MRKAATEAKQGQRIFSRLARGPIHTSMVVGKAVEYKGGVQEPQIQRGSFKP